MEDDPSDPHYISTVWGVGYRLGELVIRPARVAVGRYVPKPDDG